MKINFTYTPLTDDLAEHNKKYYDEEEHDWKGWCAVIEGLDGISGTGKNKSDSCDDLMAKIAVKMKNNNYQI